jgi:hypothetical protein
MRLPAAQSARRREEGWRLLRETDLTMILIAARVGVSVRMVRTWNAQAGWPRVPHRRWTVARYWPEPRRAALHRLLNAPGNDPADVAAALGLGRLSPAMMAAAFGDVLSPAARARLDPPVTDAPRLRAQLRAHIARQIAAFDAALAAEAAPRDPARVLRDLGGLKRLLDVLAADDGRQDAAERDDDGVGPDLPALRAEIARRYDGFVGGRAAA